MRCKDNALPVRWSRTTITTNRVFSRPDHVNNLPVTAAVIHTVLVSQRPSFIGSPEQNQVSARVGPGTIESMFDTPSGTLPSPEQLARFDACMGEVFARREGLRGKTEESAGWMARICGAARVQNQAAAAELVAIGQLFAYRLVRGGETEDWAIDTMAAVAGEVAAGLKISQGRAETKLRYARAMRERLPKVGAVFCAGDIDFDAFSTIVFRTDLIEDPQVLGRVDAVVAARVTRWPSMSRWRLSQKLDAIVARADADAVRRRKKVQPEREVYIGQELDGLCTIEGRVRDHRRHGPRPAAVGVGGHGVPERSAHP